MDIFESLENLNVSEECFNDIVELVEEYLGEGRREGETLQAYKSRLIDDQMDKQGDKYYNTLTKLVHSDNYDSRHGKKESSLSKKLNDDSLKALANYRKVMNMALKRDGFSVNPDKIKPINQVQGEDYQGLKHEMRGNK